MSRVLETASMTDLADKTVREVAIVTIDKAVDGSKRRKPPTITRSKNKVIHHIKVKPEVLRKAHELLKPNQRLVIESATCVILVNNKEQ